MDVKEYKKLQSERTVERLLKKVDDILDSAEKGGYLDGEDIRSLKDAWEAIHFAECDSAK